MLSEHVAVIEQEDGVYVARLPDGPIIRLFGTAAIVWRAVLGDGDASAADRVAATVGLAADEVADDVDGFISVLVEMGLLRIQDGERY